MSVRVTAAFWIRLTWMSCSPVSSPSIRPSRMRVMLRIELSGVRSSWVMPDRNADLSCDARASSAARSSSSAYSASTPRLVSASSAFSRSVSACCSASVTSARTSSWLRTSSSSRESSARTAASVLVRSATDTGFGTRPGRQQLAHLHRRPVVRRRVDGEPVGQAPGADQADPEAGGRLIAPVEDLIEVRDAGPVVLHADEQVGLAVGHQLELDPAAVGVLHRVAGQLRDDRGEANLILAVESEVLGDLARPPPGEHDVLTASKLDTQQRCVHAASASLRRHTTTLDVVPCGGRDRDTEWRR